MPPLTLEFSGHWRHYQDLALESFERERQNGGRQAHIVAPPGAGKTMLGMEIASRRGEPAIVLCPNSAIQQQWIQTAGKFGADGRLAAADPRAPLATLTYQALCQLRDPGELVTTMAISRWTSERAKATGATPAEVTNEAASFSGAAAERRQREIARIAAGLKRSIARGDELTVDLLNLLSPTARERIKALAARGRGQTVILDECHHLASLWGYVIGELLSELDQPFVVGLTATSPDELTKEQRALYGKLLGPVDFVIPTPAVVRDGYLAPYQELCYLTEPLDSEASWLAEHDARFNELITALHDDAESELSFPRYLIERMNAHARDEDEGATVRFADFQRRNPGLARAGIRFLNSAQIKLPAGAPHGEAFSQPPALEDWIVLLEDYALRRLAPDPGEAAAARYEQIARALSDLGFTLTRRGLRRGADEADRVLSASQAKLLGCARILEAESAVRGARLRALVLCDAELPRKSDDELGRVLELPAGAARQVLRAMGDDPATAILRPLLVTGRGLRCLERDAALLASALSSAEYPISWRPEDGLVVLESSAPGWSARAWVTAATRAFSAGASQLLIGTRALLGEGWDCPAVNCLIDLTAVAANVSARQMRGRSLRLDPSDPGKLASNWDVVCVAPELARGASDYRRFVRRHQHLHAPCEDGSIEVGPSHVHPALSPFSPPKPQAMREITESCLRRAADHEGARARWQIGSPYRGVEAASLTIHQDEQVGAWSERRTGPPQFSAGEQTGVALAGGALLAGGVGAALLSPLVAPAGLLAAPALWLAHRRIEDLRPLYGGVAPLDLIAQAIVATYRELGEISKKAAKSLVFEPRPNGYLRVRLRNATSEESRLFSAALDTMLAPAASPRYLLSRPVARPDDSWIAPLGRLLTKRFPFSTWNYWHPVPDDLGRLKERALVLERHWQEWVSPRGELVFTSRSDAGREALAEAQAQDADFQTQLRTVWD